MYRFKSILGPGAMALGLFLTAQPAAAVDLPYTPSTSLPVLSIGSTTFAVTQINDHSSAANAANGFASTSATGDITFTFSSPVDLNGFKLWNDIVTGAPGGITDFTMTFKHNGTTLGAQTYTVGAHLVPSFNATVSFAGVTSVVMHVAASVTRIEIREVAFDGVPDSFTMSCAAVQALGLPISTYNITRNSGPTTPRAASWVIGSNPATSTYGIATLRDYAWNGSDRIFLDAFPLEPTAGKKTCSIAMQVDGNSMSVLNDDHVVVHLPKSQGPIWIGGGSNYQHGTVVGQRDLFDNTGNWTYNLTMANGQNINTTSVKMTQPLRDDVESGIDKFDLWIIDDSQVKSVSVNYSLY